MNNKEPFEPLIERATKTWQRVLIVLLGVLLCIGISVVVDKAYASYPPDRVPYAWHPPRSKPLPIHTVKTWRRNKYGDLVPRYVKGHMICRKDTYAVTSKYTGVSCASKATADKVTRIGKALIKCEAYVVVGRYFGGTSGMKAAAAGCGIDWLLR